MSSKLVITQADENDTSARVSRRPSPAPTASVSSPSGWLSGAIFDLTGSYDAAFVNGIAWNLLNVTIVLWLLGRARRQGALRPVFA